MDQVELPAQLSQDDSIAPGLLEYVSRRDIATLYDAYFEGMALFEFDTEALDILFHRPGRLLDMGCGTGRHLAHFARRGFDVTGVDLSEHMLDTVRQKLAREGLAVRLERKNFCDLRGFADEMFDYVICMFSTLGMVRHRKNRAAALREACRVLAPGGVFVIHAHNRLHNIWASGGMIRLLKSYLGALVGRCEVGDLIIEGYRGVRRMYLHSYTARELRRELSAAGLEVAKLLYLNESRSGALRGGLPAKLMANGFIVIARKPVSPT